MRQLALLAALYATSQPSPVCSRTTYSHRRGSGQWPCSTWSGCCGLDWEHQLNGLFVDVDVLGLLGSYRYATAHYVVTAVVLVWLYRVGPSAYVRPPGPSAGHGARAGVVPAAPDGGARLVPGYVDVLGLHSADGGGARGVGAAGLGGFTNQLAAFPSFHAGWALWVRWSSAAASSHRSGGCSAGPTRS